MLASDFHLLSDEEYNSGVNDEHTICYNSDNILVGSKVKLRACHLNAEEGPIIIDDRAQVLEGAVVHGPAYIGKNTVIMPTTKLLGNISIGSKCNIGGELKRSYIQANTNKSHEGYLGDSVVGEWCNFGAGTNVSNLKNNFGEIPMYDYETDKIGHTTRWKAGVLMGDYTKLAIGSRINSGTVMGVAVIKFDPFLTVTR